MCSARVKLNSNPKGQGAFVCFRPLPFYLVIIMYKEAMKCGFNPFDIFKIQKMKLDDFRVHPDHLRIFGTCIFCGIQGSGKTLSAVQYVLRVHKMYPKAIIVSNVSIKSLPFNTVLQFNENVNDYELYNYKLDTVVTTEWILDNYNLKGDEFESICLEYTGLDMLKLVNNAEYGVIYLIDELHLELNSLESKNVDIEIMVEISQQRKQRKHIVGTSQIFMRLAKPLREQIHDIILCQNYFGCIQFNKWINGETVREENGKIQADVNGRFIWTHKPSYYSEYDTYAKMKRYNKEWQGRSRDNNIYERGAEYVRFAK